jgi:hypothetical protein
MFVYRTFIMVVPWTGMVDSSEKGAMGVGGDGIKSDMITRGQQEGGGRRSVESLKRRRITLKKVSPCKYIVGVTTKEEQNYLKKRR